jgi:hypothetical protein
MTRLVTQLLWPMTRPLSHWAGQSQQHACRNAMVASTAITATRRERDEVHAYVETLIANRAGRAGAATSSPVAARLG